MDTISPLIPVQRVGSATSGGGRGRGGYTPQQGQTVQATVTEALPNKLFELDLGGQKITARTDAQLSTGQTLQLQVLKTAPTIELKIVSDSANQTVGKSLTLIGKNLDVSSLFTQLTQDTNINLASLSTNSKTALTNFFNLQQDSLGLQSETKQIGQLVDKLGVVLQNLAPKNTAQQNLQLIKNNFIEIANLFKNVPSLDKLDQSFIQNLPAEKVKILNELTQFIQNNNAGKSIDQTVSQLATLLGIDITTPANNQIPTITNSLQNSLFALMHLLKGGNSSSLFGQPTESYSQNSGLGQKDGGALLKDIINNLGLKFESLLAKGDAESAAKTLKAALIEIAQQYQSSKNVAEATNRLLTTLEVFQQAQVQFDSEKQLIFPLPLPFLQQGYLVIDKNSNEEGKAIDENSGINFSLHLSLEELGNIRVDFLSNEQGLYLKFNCESSEKAEFVSGFQDDLKEAITESKLLGLTFTDQAEDPASELIKRMVPEGKSILNTTV